MNKVNILTKPPPKLNFGQLAEIAVGAATVVSVIAGGLIYVAGISSRADAAMAKLIVHDERFDRQMNAIKDIREKQEAMSTEEARMEGKLDILLQRTK